MELNIPQLYKEQRAIFINLLDEGLRRMGSARVDLENDLLNDD